MPSVLPSSVADAKLAEKKAWRRYAEARDDNWREALAEWAEARDALLAGTPRRRPARTDFDESLHNTLMRPFLGRKAMNWFSRTTSIAGIQVSNWILVIVGAVVIWIIYSFIAH
jgi:hypothetical protein